MRKFIFSLVIFLTGVSAFAGVVTKSQAENVAKNVLGASSVQYVWNGLGDKVYGDVYPAFYVFDGNGQWAIIAADDCATPVLMHGEGTFDPDNMPDNMKSLLGDVEYNIFAARNQGLAQTPEIKQAWTAYSVMTKAGSSTPVDYLVIDKDGNAGTALWNQGSPYNAKCPKVVSGGSGGHCYAGCVAAAMAIIMRFHQWPETGTGTISGYTSESYGYTIPSIDISSNSYDWANLPLTDAYQDSWNYPDRWSQTQLDKVADIIYHCGAMVEMDYGPSGSGAVTDYAISAMIDHMSYSPDAVSLSRSSYTNQQWFNMIKSELVQNHPLIYHGQNKYANSGHAFVCDGYNSNNEVHINWGWGGSYNGWFAVCYLGEVGGEGTAVYSRSDGALFGLVPATGTEPGGSSVPSLYVSRIYPDGISITSGDVVKDSEFQLGLSSIWNLSGFTYSGQVKVALLDKSGSIKEFISDGASLSLDDTYIRTYGLDFNCKITEDVNLGDYICVMYSYGADKWAPIQKYVDASVTKYCPIDITAMDIPSTFNVGQVCYPSLVFARKAASSVTWYLDGEEFTAEYIKMTAGVHTFKAVITYTDDSTETIVKKVTVE